MKSAAMEYARLRGKLVTLLAEMDRRCEENEHIISVDLYNEMLCKVFDDLTNFEAIKKENEK